MCYIDENETFIGQCGHLMTLDFSVDMNNGEIADADCADCQFYDGYLSFENYKKYKL